MRKVTVSVDFVYSTDVVERRIFVEGKEVYSDKMSTQMYSVCSDPVRKLELFLLGLEQVEGGQNGICKARTFVQYVKIVWRNLFGK